MDWIAPTDEELAAMTDEEILGPGIDINNPFGDQKEVYLGDRYPVCLGADTPPPGTSIETGPMRVCWIDLPARRLHHVPGCRCIRRLT